MNVTSVGLQRLGEVLDSHVIERSLTDLRILLKKDEFQEPERLGEYGRNVPSAARSASQPDYKAPAKRINAFYTYCACEYLLAYEPNESRTELERIFSFAEKKLTMLARYHTTRTEDGYIAGTHMAEANQELNYRHTFALSLIIALANQDHTRLSRIQALLLEKGAQDANGGWHIWESNVRSGTQPDPICSGYALVLLDYFKRYSLDRAQSDLIESKLSRTIDYLLSKLDADLFLWRAPGDKYVETYQMSVWYYTLLAPYLQDSLSEYSDKIYRSLAEGLSPERQSLLDASPFGIDVKARLTYAIIANGNPRNINHIERAIEILEEVVSPRSKSGAFTTYGLTRLMILLRELKSVRLSEPGDNPANEPILHRGAYLLGRFVRGYLGP